MKYKVVRNRNSFEIVPEYSTMLGVQVVPPGDRAERERMAIRLANKLAKELSGDEKGKFVVERIGDSFMVLEAAIVNDVDLEPDEYQDNEDE